MEYDGLTITRLDSSHHKQAARIFQDAFVGDITIRESLGLTPEMEKPFWDMAMSSYLSHPSEKATVFGGWLDGELVSCAAVHQGDFTPGQAGLLDIMKTLRRLFGYQRMFRFVVYSMQSASVVKSNASTLRLELLGTHSDYRGKGLGTKMLRFLLGEAKAKGYKQIQLEFEDGCPAHTLYQREGFSLVRDISLMGHKSYIMRRALDD